MRDRELMENISDSYDDFVNSMVRWMKRDNNIRKKILEYINTNPNATTSDILGILWECLGIGKPLEAVDDGNYNTVNSPSMQAIV